jgi:hypothetical protein
MSKPRPQAERVSDLRENIGGTGGKLIRCTDWFGDLLDMQMDKCQPSKPRQSWCATMDMPRMLQADS